MNPQILSAQIRATRKYGDVCEKRPPKLVDSIYVGGSSFYSSRGYYPNGISVPDSKGNLSKHEYTIWVGAEFSQSNFARCRICGSITRSEWERKEHLERRKCREVLAKVQELLWRDRRCVGCDRVTKNKGYGVPLCGDAKCAIKWKFREWEGMKSFEQALKILEATGQL